MKKHQNKLSKKSTMLSTTIAFFLSTTPFLPSYAMDLERLDETNFEKFYSIPTKVVHLKTGAVPASAFPEQSGQITQRGHKILGPLSVTIPVDFSAATYIAANPELHSTIYYGGLDGIPGVESRAMRHYAYFGIKEGRHYLPSTFNSKDYIDLCGLQGNVIGKTAWERIIWARQHYMENNCFIPQLGNSFFFTPSDLEWIDETNFEKNFSIPTKVVFVPYGHTQQGRVRERADIIPEDFTADVYVATNPDLHYAVYNGCVRDQYGAKIRAIKHYLHIGSKQKRRYFPSSFNSKEYIDSYGLQSHVVGKTAWERIIWARKHYAEHNCFIPQL